MATKKKALKGNASADSRRPPKSATSEVSAAEAFIAHGEAADAAVYAARQAEALRRVEAQRPLLETFKRLDEMLDRLVGVDMTFWPLKERVLRSGRHISYIRDELVASEGQNFNAVRLEMVNALWWEIRAIDFLRKRGPGRKPGAISANQKALRAFLLGKL